METERALVQQLETENKHLLSELEQAYKNMASILEQSEQEMEIAYTELDERYRSLENLYSQLSNKENMLIHLEKLSSIGQFITEIIHELKNPLAIISGFTDLALLDPDLAESVRTRIGKIPVQVERMLNHLNRFKSMAYKGKEDFKTIDLNASIREFLATIEIIKPKTVHIHSELCEDQLLITADPYQLMQIFLNLAKNAFDAMHKAGDIFSVKSEKVNKTWLLNDENLGHIGCQTQEDWQKIIDDKIEFVLLEISDSGSGIPESIVSNIFEAFFTTKGRGKGTGLGLSIAKDITIRHNANLYIKSIEKKGTTFQLIIPLEDISQENYRIVDDRAVLL